MWDRLLTLFLTILRRKKLQQMSTVPRTHSRSNMQDQTATNNWLNSRNKESKSNIFPIIFATSQTVHLIKMGSRHTHEDTWYRTNATAVSAWSNYVAACFLSQINSRSKTNLSYQWYHILWGGITALTKDNKNYAGNYLNRNLTKFWLLWSSTYTHPY